MWIFLFWWCIDDHLATAMNMPGLGELPWWIPFLIGLSFSMSMSYTSPDSGSTRTKI